MDRGEQTNANGVHHRGILEANGSQPKTSVKVDEDHPFVYAMYPTTLDKIGFLIAIPTILPLKMLATFICLAVAWLLSSIAVIGWPVQSEKPLSGWRKVLKNMTSSAVQLAWFSMGVVIQTVKGQRASSAEAPVVVMGPHSSFIDTLCGTYCGFSGVVTALDNAHIPFIGTIFRINESVFVERKDPESRKNAASEIRRRAEAGGVWPHLIVFPEGFCTNRKALPPYKPGAFLPGVPVQPAVVRYPNRIDTTTWLDSGPGLFAMLTLLFLRPCTKFELEFLPVYKPSEEEKADPQLYMNNVRDYMSRQIGIPKTELDSKALKSLVKATRPNTGALAFWSQVITRGYVEMPSREEIAKFNAERADSAT